MPNNCLKLTTYRVDNGNGEVCHVHCEDNNTDKIVDCFPKDYKCQKPSFSRVDNGNGVVCQEYCPEISASRDIACPDQEVSKPGKNKYDRFAGCSMTEGHHTTSAEKKFYQLVGDLANRVSRFWRK